MEELPSELVIFMQTIGLTKVSKHSKVYIPKKEEHIAWKASYKNEEPPF